MSKNENQNHTLQKQLAIALKSGAISITPPIKTSYQEKSLSPEEHLELMVSRGLIVDDKAKALHYIRFIGYFRLSGYSKFFRQDGTSEFKSGITFSDIFELYKFDRKLRILVMDVHKRIEIAIRVVISNHMSHKYDPHWFMDEGHFSNCDEHKSMLSEVRNSINKNSDEQIITQYYDKHNSPDLPPSWILCEIMSMGFWSKVYSNINSREDRNSIARHFNINLVAMESFLHCLTAIRNICAHHGRLWNRSFSIKPILYRGHEDIFRRRETLYAQLAIINIFVNVIADGSSWKQRLSQLFKEYPGARLSSMGFPQNWENIDFWKQI